MMELTCTCLLTFISLATSTPHGYGVKGGALAQAQAGAVAGSYGGLHPQSSSSPGSAGFSGSFAKSSSSNFAASSASSSSGSFTYSGGFSGVGLSGFPSGNGCATGGCENGSKGPHSGPSGVGSIAFGQSGAAAGSVAGQYNKDENPCTGDCSNSKPPNCAGTNCDSNKSGYPGAVTACSSGNCEPTVNSESQDDGSYKPDTNTCTSGQCNNEDTDDIYVNTSGTKKNRDHNSTPGYPDATGAVCSSGNCGLAGNSDSEDDGSYKPEYSSSSPEIHTNNDHPGQYQPPIKPSSFFSTPKESSTTATKCNSPNCKAPDAYSGTLPSSYNVPIHNSNPIGLPNPPQGSVPKCSNGNCDNNHLGASPSPSNGNTISTNNITPPHTTGSPQVGGAVSKCDTPGCDTTTLEKDYPNFVPLKDQTGSSNCATNNCAGYPLQGSGPSSSASPAYPSYPQGGAPYQGPSSHTTSPCGTPNCVGYAVTQSQPKAPTFGSPSFIAPLGQVSSSCVSGNCGAKPSTFITPPYVVPSGSISSNCASGNCGGVPSTPSTNLNIPNFGKPSHVSPPAAAITGCVSGNCPGYSTINVNIGPAASAHATPGAYKPTNPSNAPSPTGQNLPIYNGGFGGPSGLLKPNDYSLPSKPFTPVQNAKPHFPTSLPQGHLPTAVSPSFQGNVPKHPPAIHTPGTQTAAPFSPFNTVGTTSNAVAVAGATASAYSGGFGGPPGLLKPYDGGKGGPSGPGTKYQSGPSENNTPHKGFAHTGPSDGSQGISLNGAAAVTQAGSVAGAFNGGYGYQGGHVPKKDSQHGTSGCNNGCGSGSHLGNLHPGAGAGSFGLAGSFASSSSSAHASSGAATKGGYGRK